MEEAAEQILVEVPVRFVLMRILEEVGRDQELPAFGPWVLAEQRDVQLLCTTLVLSIRLRKHVGSL